MIGEFEALRIDVVARSDELIVVVCGDIDVATAPQLDGHLRKAEQWGRDVVVDLASVDFLDAAALRVLILSHRRLQATGRRLILRNVSGGPSRVLALSGFAETFDLAG